jgi:hypothetical protein
MPLRGTDVAWAGLAFRFASGTLMTIQLSYPHVILEQEMTWERSPSPYGGILYSPPVTRTYKIQVEGRAGTWMQDDSGLHVPAAEIEARRELES